MQNDSNKNKRLYYISPENLEQLRKRAPRTGNNGGGGLNVNIPVNRSLERHFAFCDAGLARVFAALPDEQDRAFIRHVLSSTFTDDLTVAENPLMYIQEIEEAAAEYSVVSDDNDELPICPFTGALIPALRRFGPLEAMAIVDWIEQEKRKK